MDIRTPWREMMKVFVWAAAAILMMAGSAFIDGESDLIYLLLMASPFLFFGGITSIWMVWTWATAPKWNGSASLGERAIEPLQAECPPEKISSDAIVANKERVKRP